MIRAFRYFKETGSVWCADIVPLPGGVFRVDRIKRMPEGSPVPGPGAPYFQQIEQTRRGNRLVVAIVFGPKHAQYDEPDWSRSVMGAVETPRDPMAYGASKS